MFFGLWNEPIPKRKYNGKYWSDIREDVETIRQEVKGITRICRRLWNNSSYRHPDFRHIQMKWCFPRSLRLLLVNLIRASVGVFIMPGRKVALASFSQIVRLARCIMAIVGFCWRNLSTRRRKLPQHRCTRVVKYRSHTLWIATLIFIIIPTASAAGDGDGDGLLSHVSLSSIGASTAVSLVVARNADSNERDTVGIVSNESTQARQEPEISGPFGGVDSTNDSNISTIAAKTMNTFVLGSVWDSADYLISTAQDFAKTYLFKARKDGRNQIVCSRASNPNSKRKSSGQLILKKAECAISCGCPWMLKFSNKKALLPKVTLTEVHGEHNHECTISGAVSAFKLSGMVVKESISLVTQLLAPLIASKKPLPCNLIRWTIKPHISKGLVLDSTAIYSIMRGVRAQILMGNFIAPPPIIDVDVMQAFTTVDITSENCSQVLADFISNSNGDNSWSISHLMDRLKEADPDYFDFRLHFDAHDQVDCVTWQVGPCRGALEKYGSKIFLDTRKNENMNSANMQYLSIIIIDDNHQIIPGSESFVFQETVDLYGCACMFTIEMSPGFSAADVEFGRGDLFLSPKNVRQWFPNITWQVDSYHFCSPTNKHNVLRKDLGQSLWNILKDSMIAAVYAKTEMECIVSPLQKRPTLPFISYKHSPIHYL